MDCNRMLIYNSQWRSPGTRAGAQRAERSAGSAICAGGCGSALLPRLGFSAQRSSLQRWRRRPGDASGPLGRRCPGLFLRYPARLAPLTTGISAPGKWLCEAPGWVDYVVGRTKNKLNSSQNDHKSSRRSSLPPELLIGNDIRGKLQRNIKNLEPFHLRRPKKRPSIFPEKKFSLSPGFHK
ncbi:uncharacterized protein ACOB7L_025938 [Callospermophilus lateralis]